MQKKKFIITIDTEFDNGWEWKYGDQITTFNSRYIPRFQVLCEKYGFVPTYLVTYEFLKDCFFVDYMKPKQREGKCEIGIHPHAWNIPPYYELRCRKDTDPGYVFLKEYPDEIIYQKIRTLIDEYTKRFDALPVSHRAARWGMSKEYYKQLNRNEILYDCSVTPLIDWSTAIGYSANSTGPNYAEYPRKAYRVKDTGIVEVPMTVCKDHRFVLNEGGNTSKRRNIKNFIRSVKGKKPLWLRPEGNNISDLLYIVERTKRSSRDYLMFMLHSSEMMPGGSPTFDTEEKIEIMYEHIDNLFSVISADFEGVSLANYGSVQKEKRLSVFG